jgi:G3E family GTPase
MADAAVAETPVTLLTGFLGAGKTTLLNRLLRRPELAGTAVLINEFGEIGLDHLLVERLDEDTVLLNAGCLCCTVRDDLARALRGLLPRIEAGEVKRVVIETTGLADPAPILHTLMADPLAANRFRLDGVVTLVDAVNAQAQLDAQEEAVRQVAVADRLVLSKTDLADADALAALRERLARLNPGAPQHVAVMGEIDPSLLLACGLFDPARKTPDVAEWLRAEAFADAQAGHDHGHDHGHHHGHDHLHGGQHAHDRNRHDARIRACCITRTEPLHWQGVGTWLEMLIATRGESLLRLKGILNIRGQERPVAIHGVQHLFHPPALLPAWPEGDPRTSRLVFILRDLEPRVIEEGLDAFEKAAGEV